MNSPCGRPPMDTDFKQQRRKGAESQLFEKHDAGYTAIVDHPFACVRQFCLSRFFGQNFVDADECISIPAYLLNENRSFDRIIGEGVTQLLGGRIIANPHCGARIQNVRIVIFTKSQGDNLPAIIQNPMEGRRIMVIETRDVIVIIFMCDFWHGGNLS